MVYLCKCMHLDWSLLFPDFPPDSRIWVFQADKQLSESDKHFLSQTLDLFFPTWTSHEKHMKATHAVLYNHILIVALDQTLAGASGCGIDKLMYVVRKAGESLQIDFFNRNKILTLVHGIAQLNALAEAGKWLREDTPVIVFHHLQKLAEIDNICIPAKDSWLASRIIPA